MKKQRFTEEQIIGVLREQAFHLLPPKRLCELLYRHLQRGLTR